jgi:hypothetical protein
LEKAVKPQIQTPAPVVAQQPVEQPLPVSPPPVIQQPVINQAVQAPPPDITRPQFQTPSPAVQTQTPVAANQVGFPKPLEQVSRTAMVALANSPVNSPVYPPQSQVQTPTSFEPAAPVQLPHARLSNNIAPHSRPTEPADLIPEDIFEENPVQRPGDAYVPRTQPIVTKKRQEEQISADQSRTMPRLDVSLGESGNGTLKTGQSVAQAAPTVIKLPEVGSETADNFAINRPAAPPEQEDYRPPNPVALAPPAGQPHQPIGIQPTIEEPPVAEVPVEEPEPIFEEVQEDYSFQAETEYPAPPEVEQQAQPEERPVIPGSGEGSVAAFLAEAMDSSQESGVSSGKSKDEILNELLGVAPKGKKKKKGLSGTTKFMLSVLAAVAVCAAIGVYYAIDKLGGFTMAGENVFGDQGLKNLKGKGDLKKYTVTDPKGSPGENPKGQGKGENPIQPVPGGDSTPPDKLDLDEIIKGVVNSGELEDAMAKKIGIDPLVKDPTAKENPKVEPIEDPKVSPVAIVPDPPAPSPLPSRPKKNYNPPPFYTAPGPDDPPLKNTHDLVDAFLRAPTWEGRIPYTYQGESLKPAIESYYQSWPDFSLDRFKMKLFQMELEEEFGGPFWVYQITKSDAEPGGVPMIIRVENGNLKVDWQVYSEFSDQHFVKFREGKINAPHTFRLVAERVSEYPGPDRPGFTDINDYICFELNPPYGGYRAFSEYAFVRKGSLVAKQLDEKIALGDDPLAVILNIDRQNFSHGIKHYVIKDFVDEGWFN